MPTTHNPSTELLSMVTAGSVDDGKSTLIGRLFLDTQSIFEDQLKTMKKKDQEELELYLFTDGLAAEREQDITIDVAYRYLNTPKRRIVIADVPGHEQYTRNMITGASNAQMALILVDARKGLIEQSKRHMFIATLLGIPHILVAVNKMDLVDYDKSTFERIKADFIDFATKLNINDLQFIPISALKGDMVVDQGENMTWYNGRTLLDYLQNLEVGSDRNLIDFRFPVQGVIRPHQDFRGYAGTIESGIIKVGEEVTILPSQKTTRIRSILIDGKERNYGFNPQSVVLTLENEVDLSRGDMIARTNNLPQQSHTFEAILCWLDNDALNLEKSYLLKHTTKTTRCSIDTLQYKIDVNTLHRENAQTLELNEIGRVHIQTQASLLFDSYERNRNTGSFILIDESTNSTVGGGMIIQKIRKHDIPNPIRKNEKPVLWFTGLSGSGKTTIADALMKTLDERDVAYEHLDGDILRESLTSHLGFSKEDRNRNIDIAGFTAKLLSKNGTTVIATFISPYSAQREKLRQQIDQFIEIYVNTPLETCEERDVKGLYKKARTGEIESFTGISDPYEAPENPDIEIQTNENSVEEAVAQIIAYLEDNGFL